MSTPSTVPFDMMLYCPAEPEGRMFPAGNPWPGDAWSADRGGPPVGGKSVEQAMKDLVAAQDTIDTLSGQLSAKDHDLAQISAQRDEASANVADLEQRAIAGEQGQAAADQRVRDMMLERDQARSDFQRVSDQLTEANARAAKAEADAANVPALTAQLETANQTIADLNGQIAALSAPAKPNGKAAKTADTAEPAAEAAPEPTQPDPAT